MFTHGKTRLGLEVAQYFHTSELGETVEFTLEQDGSAFVRKNSGKRKAIARVADPATALNWSLAALDVTALPALPSGQLPQHYIMFLHPFDSSKSFDKAVRGRPPFVPFFLSTRVDAAAAAWSLAIKN